MKTKTEMPCIIQLSRLIESYLLTSVLLYRIFSAIFTFVHFMKHFGDIIESNEHLRKMRTYEWL